MPAAAGDFYATVQADAAAGGRGLGERRPLRGLPDGSELVTALGDGHATSLHSRHPPAGERPEQRHEDGQRVWI